MTTTIKDPENKYFKIIQDFVNTNNIGWTIKYIKFTDISGIRSINVSFKEKPVKGHPSVEVFAKCNFNAEHTAICGGHYEYFPEEVNMNIRFVRKYVGNLFWIWLCHFDQRYNDPIFARWDHNVILKHMQSAFNWRHKNHPDELKYNNNFKSLIDQFNLQLGDGIFGLHTDMIDIRNVEFDWDNPQMIDIDKSILW